MARKTGFGVPLAVTLAAAALVWLAAAAVPASADHTKPHQCGVKSASFARTCRPGAHSSCVGAVKRGVKGFTADLCAARKAACLKCLGEVQVCIGRIGHAASVTCGTCTAQFDACYAKHYPAS